MRPSILIRYTFLLIVALLAASCGGAEQESPSATRATVDSTPSPTTEPVSPTPFGEALYGLAQVEEIEIQILESFPVQINVLVSGVLPNGCTVIDEAIVQEEGNSFNVALTTVREPDQPCSEAEEPFEERIPLDVLGLEAGTYEVNVNGVESTFTLDIDNTIQEEEPTPTPVAEATPEATPIAESSSISGLVWHDLCIEPAPGEDLDPAEADPRCINDSGDLRADGRLDDEPGIEGIQISLGKGACPVEENAFEFTSADGTYIFESLAPGTYCVSIDESSEENRGILLAGEWTSPGIGVAQVEVNLNPGDNPDGVDFGWDYRFLPIDSDDPATCTNSFGFLEDLNYPDNTAVPPEAEFTKQWRLFNNGTCPWTNEYSIVFVGGDFSPSDEAISLNRNIVPGQTLTVGLDVTAPETPGTYRLNWQIADANGEPFGINAVIEDAFFVQFIVDENAAPAGEVAPNSAAIGGVVWDDFCLSDDPGSGCIEFPEESGNFIGDGTFTAAEEPLSDITISLASIACPTDGTLPPDESVIATTLTDDQGLYRFENLSEGTYCIFMDALSDENVNLLIPGNWTYPATGVGRYTFFLDPGEQALDLDFGWDYVD